jgi:hypothetical protein
MKKALQILLLMLAAIGFVGQLISAQQPAGHAQTENPSANAALVYVVGQVVQPQAILFKERMTLTQAIAMAGGMRRNSNSKRIRVFRTYEGTSTREVITVDLNKIKKNRAVDLMLRPSDVIEVPDRHPHPGPFLQTVIRPSSLN